MLRLGEDAGDAFVGDPVADLAEARRAGLGGVAERDGAGSGEVEAPLEIDATSRVNRAKIRCELG